MIPPENYTLRSPRSKLLSPTSTLVESTSSVLRESQLAVTGFFFFCFLILSFLSLSVTPRLHMSGMCLNSHICELQCGEGQSQRHRWHPDGDR